MTLSLVMSENDRKRISIAFDQDCRETNMTARRIGEVLDFDDARISRCRNPDHAELPPILIAMAVGSINGNFRTLHVIAEICGFSLSRDERPVAADLINQTAQVLTEAGEAVAAIAAHQRRPSPNTAIAANKECGDLIDIVSIVRGVVSRDLGGA